VSDQQDEAGIFGSTLGESAPKLHDPTIEPERPPVEPPSPSNPSNGRRALRRLQDRAPSTFEKVVDLLYEWREHSPQAQVTDVMRSLLTQNHNLSDEHAIAAMKGLIAEARRNKINTAIAKLGLDEAERVLGLKNGEEGP
jgi:hypothetical protein